MIDANVLDSKTAIVVVGQRVYSRLYGGRFGVVFAISGEQKPDSCQSLANIVCTGGTANFDIVFDNGTISKGLPETILRGIQWHIYDEVVGQDEIEAMIGNAERVAIEKRQEEARKAKARDRRRAEIKEKYPYLTQTSRGESSSKVAAKNMRIELKKAYPSVKFSVRMGGRGSSAINVTWTDGPTDKQVEEIVLKYKEGSFNGMDDIYEYNKENVWPDVFGGSSYVFTRREYSDELVAEAISAVFERYKVNFERAGIAKPPVKAYQNGALNRVQDPARHHYGYQSVQSDIDEWLSQHSVVEAKPVKATKASNKGGNSKSEDGQSDEVTIRPGTRNGYVEVLFPAKPGNDILKRLKDAGFRFTPRDGGKWYGKEESLPTLP